MELDIDIQRPVDIPDAEEGRRGDPRDTSLPPSDQSEDDSDSF